MSAHVSDGVTRGSIESTLRQAVAAGLLSAADLSSPTAAKTAIDTAAAKAHVSLRPLAISAKNAIDAVGRLIPEVSINAAAVLQVETATVAGTIGAAGAGNVTVVVTSARLPGGSRTLSVAVANNDTAAQVADKIRTALAADALIAEHFDVSGAGTAVVLTNKVAYPNDSTMNISTANGTSTGLTNSPTSANTTAGVNRLEDIYNAVSEKWNAGFPITL